MSVLGAAAPPEGLRRAHKEGLVIPWVGAGLSNAIANKNLPDYGDLILTCLEAAQTARIDVQGADEIRANVEQKAFKKAATCLRSQLNEKEFSQIIRAQLRDDNPAPSLHHRILNLMEFRVYFTTNYDRILDQILLPRPAVLTYRDHSTMRVILDEPAQGVAQQVPTIMKLNGDISAPPTIVLGQSARLGLYDGSQSLGRGLYELFYQCMAERTFLFIGYSFDDPDLRGLLIDIGKRLRREYEPNKVDASGNIRTLPRHYAVVPFFELERMSSRNALEDAGIEFIGLDLEPEARDGDRYRALWQFLSQIPEARNLNLSAGHMERTFFLTKDRPDYLLVQNRFETKATSFRFLTPGLTNALTTPGYLKHKVAKELQEFSAVPGISDWEEWQRQVLGAMQMRADTFNAQLQAGSEFRILCEKTTVLDEIKSADAITLDRYTYLLELLGLQGADVEVRLYDTLEDSTSLSSFASLIRPVSDTSDIAVAYATQATTTEFKTHIFEMNSQFAKEMLILFEKEWARANTEEVSCMVIKKAVNERKTQLA